MKEQLNELNIFALRDLARRTGVKSPTSKKKEELIQDILKIMSGEMQPNEKTKQGRPPKVFGYEIANMFSANSQPNMFRLTLNQPVKKFKSEDVKTISGWLELGNNNSALLLTKQNNETYFVPKDVVQSFEVKTGDLVVAEVCNEENQHIVKSILSINDCPIMQLQPRKAFSSIEHVSQNKPLSFSVKEFNSLNLNVGENIYVYGTNNKENTTKIIEMLNSSKVENKIYLNVSLTDKNKSLLNELNVEKFVANITDDSDFVRRIVSIAIERAKRILETGEEVLFVVDDMLSISAIEKDLNLVKKLASISKFGENGGSITLLAVMPSENIIQIEKLADSRLKIENQKITKI